MPHTEKKAEKSISGKFWAGQKILPFILFCGLILILIIIFIMNIPEEEISIDFSKNLDRWKIAPGTKVQIQKDSIELTKEGMDFFVVVPNVRIDADYYNVCILEIKQPVAFGQGRLFFLSPYNRQYDFNFRFDFDSGKANRFNKILIDLRKHAAWHGFIREILIAPPVDSKTVHLKSIRFVHANPWTTLRALWSDFTLYSDPLLGTCFAMASPLFLGKNFNSRFIPILWGILLISGLILGGTTVFRLDSKSKKIIIAIFFLVFLLLWILLDLRNTVHYLKAIKRDTSLYWGKPLEIKRGIVTGDPEFVDFINFCDKNIPLTGKIFNFVPNDLPGTPRDYLSTTQVGFILRPRFYSYARFSKEIPKPYYIFYKSKVSEIKGVDQQQSVIDSYFLLPGKQKIHQGIVLERYLEDISNLRVKVGPEIDKENISVSFLDKTKKTKICEGILTQLTSEEAIFKIIPKVPYTQNRAFIEIENKGNAPIKIAVSNSDKYRNGELFIGNKKYTGDLTFWLDYHVKNLKIFKKFNEHAFILTK